MIPRHLASRMTWAELILGIFLFFFPIGLAVSMGSRDGAAAAVWFWSSWLSLAFFIGSVPAIILLARSRYAAAHIVAALFILAALPIFLAAQPAPLSGGLLVWIGNILGIGLLWACVRANRTFPRSVRFFAIPIGLAALLSAIEQALLTPSHFFIPPLLLPGLGPAEARAVFLRVFGGGIVASFLLCLAIGTWATLSGRLREPEYPEPLLAREVGSLSIARIIAALALTLGIGWCALYYLVPASSAGGCTTFPADPALKSDPDFSPEGLARYLTAHGWHEATPLSTGAKPLPTAHPAFRYDLSAHRSIFLTLETPEKGQSLRLRFDGDRLTMAEASRARRVRNEVSAHFVRLFLAKREARP